MKQIEDENRQLKAQSSEMTQESWETNFLPKDLKLLNELEHLESLGKNFPNGCLFRLQIDAEILERADAKNIWFQHLFLVYLSPSWELISDIPRDDIMTDFTLSIKKLHHDDAQTLMPIMYRCLVDCSPFNAGLRYCYSDGSIRWIQVATHPRREGRSIVCEGYLFDVSAHKTIESDLSLNREELELLVKEQTIELKTINEELAVTNEELSSINEELNAVNEELQVKNAELNRYRSNLEKMVEEKTIELTMAKEKAEESGRLKSAFLANMSHEIRTPLSGIAGLLNVLSADVQLPETIREHIGLINSNCEQVTRLFNDILDAAKMEAGQMQIRPEPISLNELVDDVIFFFTQYLRTAEKTHVKLEKHSDGSVENDIIFADPVRLKQILNNLLSNATKFTEQGYIRVGYGMNDDNMLEFFVEDTGIGIPEDQHEIIFLRFRQVEKETIRKYGGTGLGLSISRGLVQLMGGDMRVESTEGKGSKFTFNIEYHPCEII